MCHAPAASLSTGISLLTVLGGSAIKLLFLLVKWRLAWFFCERVATPSVPEQQEGKHAQSKSVDGSGIPPLAPWARGRPAAPTELAEAAIADVGGQR